SPVSRLTILHSVLGAQTPTEPNFTHFGSAGDECVTGLVSVMPYPCRMLHLSRSMQSLVSASPSGAAPLKSVWSFERSYSSTSGLCSDLAQSAGQCEPSLRRNSVR